MSTVPIGAPPKGRIGSWFAEVVMPDAGRQRLPCVHRHWLTAGLSYDDPGALPGVAPWPEFVAGIQTAGRVILTDDDLVAPDGGRNGGARFRRRGYVAVYEVAEVRVEADADGSHHLRLRLAGRLMNFRAR